MPLVVAKGLTRLFGKNGIEGVDLEVSAGEVVGLIGPNGGGKSTLLMLLAGLLEPSHGHVHIEGVRSTVLARNGAGKVGLITSQYGLYPFLSGRENLDFFGGLFGLKPSDVTERVGSWLEDFGLTPHLDARSRTYSSGMKQKLSLCRALLMDPVLLLMDEPTANLDPESAQAVFRLCRTRAERGLAVVVATHDLHSAQHVCDRVIAIDRSVKAVRTLEGDRSVPVPELMELYT